MSRDSLNQFMEELTKAGEFESAGVFTLDVDKAGDKVQRFQLVDPYLYVAHLVAAASLAGAKDFKFSKTASQVCIGFDGRPFELSELETLSHGLLAGYSGERRVQELAIAVMGARATEPERLVWESVGASGTGVRLSYEGEKRTIESVQSAEAGNRLILDYPVTWKRIRGRFDTKSPEAEVLRNFCARAPLRITTDLELLNQNQFGPQDFLAWKHLRGTEIHAPMLAPARRSGFCVTVSWREPFSAVLCLANPIYSEVHELTIVLNGVSFRRAKVLGCPYACGIVYVSHLNKNLSHTDLVEDSAYHELIELLRARIDELWRQFADYNVVLPKLLGDRVASYLSRRYPIQDRPLDISSYLLRHELDTELLGTDKGFEYLEQAKRFEEADNPEQAAIIRTKVLDSANRGLSRDYSKKLDNNTPKLARLRMEALRALNRRSDPESLELYRITTALVGGRVDEMIYPDEWSRFRAALMALAVGQEDWVERLAGGLKSLEAWKFYLLAELRGDLELYLKAATVWESSGFLWHEAASAHLLAGRVEQGLQCRIKATERSPNSPYFPRRLAKELSGKFSFIKWVSWSLKAQFSGQPEAKILEIEGALQRDRIMPNFALEALEQYSPQTKEYEYLVHCILWSWRANRSVTPEACRQFLAKSLLRRSVNVTNRGIRLSNFTP